VLLNDDPTGEIGAAWGVQERLRQLLACRDLEAAEHARGLLGIAVLAADTDETWRLWEIVNVWWDEDRDLHRHPGSPNARTEAANTAIEHIKRTGRGYRNHGHYQTPALSGRSDVAEVASNTHQRSHGSS
jgi:hypothetical protein